MAKLLDDEQIIKLKLEENLEDSLLNYSEMLESSPFYLDYFNKNISASTQDELDVVYQVLGAESPVQYNRVKSFPIYGLQQISLDLTNGVYGPEAEVDSECIILPRTIVPVVDDFISVPYEESGTTVYALFRVTKVDKSILNSKRFFKLSISLTTSTIEQVESQVEKELIFSVTDYESNRKSIVLLSESELLKKAEFLRRTFVENYALLFEESDVSSFCIQFDNGFLLNYYLHDFLELSGAFEFDRSFLATHSILFQPQMAFFKQILLTRELFFYQALLEPTTIFEVTKESFYPIKSTELIFDSFRSDYYECNLTCGEASPDALFISEDGFLEKIKTNSLYADDLHILEDIIIDYVNTYVAGIDQTDLINRIAVLEVDYTMKHFFLFPCIIFILKKIEDIITLNIN